MITKHIRTLIIGFILFGLTSSCEDKDRQTFGKVNLTFDYQETVEATNTSSKDTTENRTAHSEPSQDEFEREQGFIKDRERSETSLEIDVILDENEDLIERSSELKQDYCCARIQINNGTPLTLDLSSQNTYSRTVPIGSTLINVDLLTFSNIVLYSAVKSVQVNEDVNTSVSFLPSDWVVQNQEIEITSDFNSTYAVGDNIPIAWTNTHTARGVKIEMIQSTTANVVKVLENNFIGDSYTFDTSSEPPRNNVGIKVTSMLNDTMFSRCCFDIEPANEAPTVVNISETINEDGTIVITLEGSDGDDDSLTFSVVTDVSNGSLNWLNGTQLRYTPNSNYNGSDTFTYKANDGIQDSDTATVTITIEAVNDAPTTNDVSTTIDENRTARVADLTLDGNDVDEDNLTYSLSSNPSNGTASINGNILTYNANQDWNGVETFTYIANDGELDSNASTITITVTPVNDDPTTDTSVISISTDEDLYVDIDLAEYVTDIDGDDLTFEVVSEVQNGATAFISSNVIRYQPTIDYNGQDSFTWRASDGSAQSDEVTVNITVNAMDEFEFIYPLENDIIEFGDNPIVDWNVHPFNEYEVDIYYYFTNGSTSHYLDIGDISSENDSSITWNYDSEVSTSLMGYFKFRIKDKASESEFFSEKFKLLPLTNTKINGSTNNNHSIQTNSTIEASVDWNDNIQRLRMGYAIYTLDNELIYSIGSNNLPEEGVGTGNSSTIPSPCWTVEQCTTKKNESFTIPISDKLFNTGTQYLLKTLLMKDGDSYPIFIAEIDTLNVSSSKTEEVSILPFENNNFTYYDRIPVTFTASGVDNVKLGLSSYKSGPSWNDYDLTVSSNSSEKTVNFDLDRNNLDDYFNSQSEASTVAISAIDYDFYNSIISSNTDYFGQSNLSVNNNLLSDDIPGSGYLLYRSDTLSVEIQRPHIKILSPQKNSVNTVGQPLEITWQTTGLRNAVVDMCLEKGGEICIIDDTVNDGSLTFTPYLEDLYSLTSPQGSLAGSSDTFEIRLYGINSHDNPNEASPVTHQNINYDSGEWWITLDASEIDPHEVVFPNGGENLVVGDTYNFEWNFEAVAESLVVKLVKQGTGTVVYTEKVLNDGNHPLTIPDVDKGEYKFRLEQTENRSYFSDTSDNSFNIVDSSSSTTYGGDVSDTLTSEFVEHNIEVSENGSISDLRVTVSLEGDRSDHLRFIELYLVSPQGTRVLLAGGDQMPNYPIGGAFSSSTNSLVTTVFDDSAEKDIYAGTPPYISSHRPEENLSTFFGEDQQGTWKLLVVHNTTESIDISYVSLEIDAEDYHGYIYEEDNGWIFSTDEITGSGQLEIPGNSTRQLLVNADYNSNANNLIDDLDVQLLITGDRNDHLRFLTISLVDAGFNPPRKSVILFKGDQISTGGYNKTFNVMKKLRFDDQVSETWNNNPTTLFTRIKPVEPLSSFTDTAYQSFYISVTNTASESAYLHYGFANKQDVSALFIDTRPNDSSSPSANDMSVSTIEDTALEIILDANDDIDGGSIDAYEVLSQPSNGILSAISSAGVITYMPSYNYSGSDSFTYRVKDNDGNYSNTGTVNVTISAVDEQPAANNVTASTNEDTPVDVTLTASEYDGDTYEFVIVSQPSNGTATITSAQATYTPNENFNGVDTFTFQAQDTQGRMNVATATITVNSINDIPAVEDIAVSVDEDNSIEIQLEGTDIETENLTFTIVDNVSNGTTELNGSVVTYTPDANWNGTDTFTYKANDGTDDSNIATTSITVNGVSDYVIYMHAGTTNGTGSSDNPLNNFADASAAIEQDPSTGYGTIILKPGTYISSPDNKVRINDTDGIHIKSESGNPQDTIITEDNDTGGNEFSFVADNLIIESVTLSGVIGGGQPMAKASHDSLVLKNIIVENNTVTSAPAHGSFEVTNSDVLLKIYDSKFINNHHELAAFFKGQAPTEIFNSIFIDNSQGSNGVLFDRQSITIEDSRFIDNAQIASQLNGSRIVIDNNNTVNAFSRAYLTNSFLRNVNGGGWPVSTPGEIKNSILINVSLDSNTNGGQNNYWKDFYNVKVGTAIAVHSTQSNQQGSVVLDSWEDIKFLNYNPTTQTASESSDYRLDHHSPAIDAGDPEDDFSNEPAPNGGRINAGIFGNTISAQITNSAPVTTDVFASTNEDTSINITLGGSDDDNDSLSYSVVASNNGTISLNGAVATYTPNANWNGTDTFTYKANDGLGDSNTSTVTVTVNAIDDAPTTSDINVSTDEDNAVEIPLEGADVDGDNLTYSINTDNMAGTATLNGSTVLYTPDNNSHEDTSFTYTASDGSLSSNTSTVAITVNAVNDPHVVSNIDETINEDTPSDFVFSSADIDGGTQQVWSIVAQAENGVANIIDNPNGIVRYTPNENWNGTDTFTFKVNDGDDSNIATATITVTAVNDPPVSSNISASTNVDTSVNITLQATDVENDNLTYTIDSNVSNGTTSLSGNVVTYTPNTNWNGTDTFTYKANDGTDDSNTSTVTITVNETTPSAQDGNHSIFLDKQVNQITLNASDPQGDELTYSITSQPSKGSISLQGNQVTYTPSGSSVGEDSFTFTASDQSSTSDPATVTLNLQAYGGTSIELQKDVSSGIFNSWIEVENNTNYNDNNDATLSMSFWIYLNDLSNDASLFSRYSTESNYWSIELSDSSQKIGVKLQYDNGGSVPVTNYERNVGIQLNENEWNHIGLSIDTDASPEMTFYLNGSLLSTLGVDYYLARLIVEFPENYIIGLLKSGGTSNQFLGKIDDFVLVKDAVLSDDQFADLYNNGNGISDIISYLSSYDLETFLRFNEGSGTDVDDQSPNNFTTTINGGAIWSSD